MSIAAYRGLPDALSGPGQPELEMPASPAIASTSPSPGSSAGGIALDASSANPAPDPTRDDDHLAENLSTLMFLHKTRDESGPVATTTRFGVCSH